MHKTLGSELGKVQGSRNRISGNAYYSPLESRVLHPETALGFFPGFLMGETSSSSQFPSITLQLQIRITWRIINTLAINLF